MTAARRLAAIQEAAEKVAPAATVQVLHLNGIPRCGLTVREVAQIWSLPYRRILNEIKDGRVRVISGGRDYVIPVSELAVIANWAKRLDPTA